MENGRKRKENNGENSGLLTSLPVDCLNSGACNDAARAHGGKLHNSDMLPFQRGGSLGSFKFYHTKVNIQPLEVNFATLTRSPSNKEGPWEVSRLQFQLRKTGANNVYEWNTQKQADVSSEPSAVKLFLVMVGPSMDK